ncbi:hypothetical protein EFP00_09685 [Lactiplantibacillus paraplantarum]|uniref:hypothetical protein n=1 Tax=Lactiplantibacillus paraplantarum TaxID=60520 RepID=UPI0021A44307|nr:hypothetical protein [Lactiplantibacillus paraplantarum]MCT4457678.1 hypothetical protein [Lactiplantibacillus paraplantarum]
MTILIKVQFQHLIALIRMRLIGLLTGFLLILFVEAIRLNPMQSSLERIATGPSLATVASGNPYLPIFWIALLILPTLIVGNGIQNMWQSLFQQIKGLGFSKRQFGIVNVILLILINLGYLIAIQLLLALVDLFTLGVHRMLNGETLHNHVYLSVNLFLALLLLSLVQQIFSWLHRGFLLIMPLVLLVYTAFTAHVQNPLNLTMWSRISEVHSLQSFICAGFVALMIVGYIYFYGNYEVK